MGQGRHTLRSISHPVYPRCLGEVHSGVTNVAVTRGGGATDGVALFFPQKVTTFFFFSYRPLESKDRPFLARHLSAFQRRLSSVYCKITPQKFFFGYHRAG